MEVDGELLPTGFECSVVLERFVVLVMNDIVASSNRIAPDIGYAFSTAGLYSNSQPFCSMFFKCFGALNVFIRSAR